MGLLPGPRGVSAVLLALLLAAQPPSGAPAPSEDPAALAVRRHLLAVEETGSPEARKMLGAALDVAGRAGVPVLVRRLGEVGDRPEGAAAAWALGEALRPPPGEAAGPAEGRAEAVAALVAALGSEAGATRLAAASALGVLEAREAEPALLDLTAAEELPPAAEDVVLLALAGMKGRALSLLEGRLDRGGGRDWSDAVVLSFLRWGGDSWPELVLRADRHPDPRVRVSALTALLLLAEPASACELGELYGREEEPVLRRVILQALSATRHPLARDQLALIARTESNPQLREAAELLVADLVSERRQWRDRRGAHEGLRLSVPELLAGLERRPGYERHVDEIAERADPVHVEAIDRLLRRLPLRGDERALSDHARLAQARARLLCLDGLDCER